MNRSVRRRVAGLLVVLAGVLGIGLLLAGPASAHATVVTSSPADGSRLKKAPADVTITFDESVGLGTIGYLHVTDGTGKRVDAGPATHPGGDGSKVTDKLVSGLGNSTYTASFRVISADSHPVAGTIRFVVGNGALARGSIETSASNNNTATAFDVTRWISYVGLALLGGGWLLFTVWPDGRDEPRARALVWGGWGATVVGALLELLLQGPFSSGAGPGQLFSGTLIDATLHSDYGIYHCIRLVLLGALALTFSRGLQWDSRPRNWGAAAGVLAVGIVFTFSAAGHADTTNPAALSVPLDMLHLLSMMAWIGGLVVLVGALLPRRDAGELRAVLPTFSTVAFASVVVLAGTGTYAAWRGIGTVHAIFDTTYGLLVVGKIILFLGLLALGNLSRLVVRRRFNQPEIAYAMSDSVLEDEETDETHEDEADEDADDDGWEPYDDDPVATERMRRSVLVETGVGLLVLALSAVLVAEPRGKEALAAQYRDPVSATAALGGGRTITVTSDPGTHGTVQLSVALSAGAAPTSVTASATQTKAQIGPIPVTLSKSATDTYGGSASLPVAGAWEIDLVVTTSRFDATTTDVVLHLH